MMKKIAEEISGWEASDERLKVAKEDLVETNALHLWNSYLSNGDYFSRYRQVFSILGFLCVETLEDEGNLLLERVIEILVKLAESPYRIVRFCSIIAFASIFRSLTISIEEAHGKIESLKSKKKSANKAVDAKLLKAQVEALNELISLSVTFMLIPKSKDICPIVREEVYSNLIHYLERRDLDTISDIKDEDHTIIDIVLQSINDEDKSAKAKGIELVEKFLLKSFNHTPVTQSEKLYEDLLKS